MRAGAHRSPAALRGTIPAVHGGVSPCAEAAPPRLGLGRGGEASPPVVRGRWSLQEDRRGRPVCRPVSGSRAEVCPGGHIGPPLHGVEGIPNQRKIGAKTDLANGAGQSPPPTDVTEQGGLRRGAPGVWLPPTKFRNGIWGVSQGHPALRKRHRWCAAKGRCGHRPLQEEGEASATTQASGTERIVHAAVARDGWNSEQKASPKCPATSDNPSVSLRLTAPFTQGSLSLRGTGDADCRVGPVGLLAMTAVFCHSEERSDVGIRPFFDGRGTGVRAAEVVGPYGTKREPAATAGAALSEAEGAERGAGQIQSLPDK